MTFGRFRSWFVCQHGYHKGMGLERELWEWNAVMGLYEHMIRANELKLHIHRTVRNAQLTHESYDSCSIQYDMRALNVHLNLARKMRGVDVVFSLNEMEKRWMNDENLHAKR